MQLPVLYIFKTYPKADFPQSISDRTDQLDISSVSGSFYADTLLTHMRGVYCHVFDFVVHA